ncbi:MAG: hypothetical protein HOK54_06150 [Alphaproteobacteria bacterium]|nr:hypothetical protein [Alphaproteobacteria bacterium]
MAAHIECDQMEALKLGSRELFLPTLKRLRESMYKEDWLACWITEASNIECDAVHACDGLVVEHAVSPG